MSDPYNIIMSVPAHLEPDMESVRDADLVIHGNMVIKDRFGPAPRPATPEEIMRAHGVDPPAAVGDVVLDVGSSNDEDYLPAVVLTHGGDSSELYVIVGEEAAGMAEGVPAKTFARIFQRIEILQRVEKLLDTIAKDGGQFAVSFDPDKGDTSWSVMAVFGREAEDSPMAGGALHGIGATAHEALDTK